MEQWRIILDFPRYEVSTYGRVRNRDTGRIMRMNQNQSGLLYVGLVEQGVQHILSVPRLVAHAFVMREYGPFDTPINLDGDRLNNHVDNLMWRPLWFARRYNRQFVNRYKYPILRPIEDLQTGDVFEDTLHVAITYGLLEEDVVTAIKHKTNVWPTDRYFGVYYE